jgi:hypothetical protein
MTKEEKFTAIIERLGEPAKDFKPLHISVLVIMDYMTTMFKEGIINDGEVEITSIGNDVVALCNEFDWKPSDNDIVAFCSDMVDKEQLESFVIMLREMRDNQTTFLTNAKKNR